MIYVKTTVAPSNISGLGLFAAENIPTGTLIWKFEAKLDIFLTKEEARILSEEAKKQIWNYAFYDKKRNGYILCGDDARFFNHSNHPNCDDSNDDTTIALRDIHPGEELTVDYRTFDGDLTRHIFLNQS